MFYRYCTEVVLKKMGVDNQPCCLYNNNRKGELNMKEELEPIVTSAEELRQQGKVIYAKMQKAYNQKDWLNFNLLADQLKNIKEDLEAIAKDECKELEKQM